jgi:hypothetical protein
MDTAGRPDGAGDFLGGERMFQEIDSTPRVLNDRIGRYCVKAFGDEID